MGEEAGGEASQEELLRQQKAACIFCKIASGEAPAKRVYEDERVISILDINPAVKGHALVMTKEHYPIMPLLPREEFEHLFGVLAPLSGAIREGAMAERVTVFIANGAVAGQQSPHFLFHVIPREDGDGLSSLDVQAGSVNQSDRAAELKNALYAVMRQHLTQQGSLDLLQVGAHVSGGAPRKQGVVRDVVTREVTKESRGEAGEKEGGDPPVLDVDRLAKVINENPELKELLVDDPARLERLMEERPELKRLFAGVNLRVLSDQLRGGMLGGSGGASRSSQAPPSEKEAVTPAARMTIAELFAFIDGKPKLRDLILHDPEGLKALIPQNERLAAFFSGSDVDAIISAYRARAAKAASGGSSDEGGGGS